MHSYRTDCTVNLDVSRQSAHSKRLRLTLVLVIPITYRVYIVPIDSTRESGHTGTSLAIWKSPMCPLRRLTTSNTAAVVTKDVMERFVPNMLVWCTRDGTNPIRSAPYVPKERDLAIFKPEKLLDFICKREEFNFNFTTGKLTVKA
jgi:hypothetical protein